jgi:nucleoid DNA-binding protein
VSVAIGSREHPIKNNCRLSRTALKQGERVNISGFGTFTVSAREARTGRNPKTGEPVEISASRSAKFKPGKQLKESLNGVGAVSQATT